MKQVDSDTVEIIKRRDVKLGWLYRIGRDQPDVYERVTINRAAKTVSRDRINANYWFEEPFMSQRDYFYLEQRETHPQQLTFVQHNYWVSWLFVFPQRLYSSFSAMSYARAFKRAPKN